ncbi:MAG: hypothetical protein LBQ96_08360, partial [Fusobacteriaceae bacterium]|nr:hypothetical protein [Fusobacteriaceae bacterium]
CFLLFAAVLNAGNKFSIPLAGSPSSSKKEDVFGVASDMDVDFTEDLMHSDKGVDFTNGQVKIKARTLKRSPDKETIYAEDDFISEMTAGPFKMKIEGKNGEISAKGDSGTFNGAFGYVNVSPLTLSEHPNTRIFFSGDTIDYRQGKITLRNGRITTDPKVVESGDLRKGGYHFLSESIVIENDKQVTLRNSDFFVGKRDYFPFRFPWYRLNIRNGSTVPLFPNWTDDDYYGWQISWGFLYGNSDSKFKGGFAPKYADTMGLLVGRWENWYKTDRFGTAKLNLDDFLVYSKAPKTMRDTNPMAWEQKHRRYRLNFSHDYDDKYGKFHFNSWYGTRSMIPDLDDLINKYQGRGWFDNPKDAVPTARPHYDKNIGFYSLDADLKGMGPDEDISFKGIMKMTDDKKTYSVMVYDIIDDISYGSSVDNDLYSHFELYKDNKKYKIGGYYQYLYDMDPGSTARDLKSRAENFGFEFFEKKHNIGFSYDEKNENKYRPLNYFERDPNLDSLVTVDSLLGSRFRYSYNPTTVREYVRYDSKDLRISLGEYDLVKNWRIRFGADIKEHKRELDPRTDALRQGRINNNSRDLEYNRFQDILREDFRETSAWVETGNDDVKIRITGGKTVESFLSREGLYDGSSRKYVNESQFYETLIEKNSVDLKKLGEAALSLNLRYDRYDKGHNPYTDTPVAGADSSLRGILKANHMATLWDNKTKTGRKVDFSLTNDLLTSGQFHMYNQGSMRPGNTVRSSGRSATAKEIRLEGKENFYEITDTLSLELGNTETRYKVNYKKAYDAGVSDRVKNEVTGHRVDFLMDGQNKLSLWYNRDRRYTDERLDDRNYNNLTYGNYGIRLNYGRHGFDYARNTIRSDITRMLNTDDAEEKIVLDTYGYRYRFRNDDQITFRYQAGTDIRNNWTKGIQELDVDNRSYSVSYLDAGEIEHQYSASYSTYQHREAAGNTLVLGGKRYNARNVNVLYLSYEYRDKRIFEEEMAWYGKREYGKDEDKLTAEELDRVREILQNRQNDKNTHNFSIDRIRDEKFKPGLFRRHFKAWTRWEINDARYKTTGDFLKSLQEVNAGLTYSYKRLGVGYAVTINNGWSGTNWIDKDLEHKISLHAKVGKPSRSWNFETYARFYDKRNDSTVNPSKRKASLEALGIEIGKEFGYYQWAVSGEAGYNATIKDYEWKVALQFTLLTFPNNAIFGLGAQRKSSGKTSPATYLFNGIKPERALDD